MKLRTLAIVGAYVIDLEAKSDERGSFARTYCEREFQEAGLHTHWVQSNTSFNERAGTLRGLHYQIAPHEEIKLGRCIRGALFDVIVDMRPASKTFKQWVGTRMQEGDGQLIYVPAGCAHGYLTLADRTEFSYSASAFYEPTAERSVRYDDPAIAIEWPTVATLLMSEKDRLLPLIASS